jgi:hypothetical protein
MATSVKELTCVLYLCLAVASSSAQGRERSAADKERQIAANPTYSSAVHGRKSPEDLLAEWEAKLDSARGKLSPEFNRFLALPFAAKAALEAGANEKAKSYAEEALRFPTDHADLQPPFKYFGIAVIYCNLVLGRLALLDGDIAKAEEYLLLSGQTDESSGVSSVWGPNMSLARELLKRARKDTVLKYLDECKLWWKPEYENGKLTKWAAEIERDAMPVFGPNLFY